MGLGVILDCFFRAIGQLFDPRFRKVLLTGLGLTLALLIGATFGVVWLTNWLLGDGISIFGWRVGWLDQVLAWGSGLVMLVLSSFLMVPVASAMTSLFLDEVAQAVEDRHYPNLPVAQSVPFSDALRDTLNFLGVLIFANICALVLYLIFIPLAPLIFWSLNGFLLGREYFMIAAMRRVGRAGAKTLRSQHAGTIWLAGILMAVPLSIPLVNLLIPILGAATFTHLFHALRAERNLA